MRLPSHRDASIVAERSYPRCVDQGLNLLARAFEYARELKRDVWDFAVEFEELRSAGLSMSDLRWLICKGYVEFAIETTPAGQQKRCFSRNSRLAFRERNCLVLTEAGAAFWVSQRARIWTAGTREHRMTVPGIFVPRWDGVRRELRVGECLVKCFKQPAPYQETILAAFEEEGWPPRIDDPLPPRANSDPKRHLQETINNLNRHQRERVIRFFGDGNARGVRWELRS